LPVYKTFIKHISKEQKGGVYQTENISIEAFI